MTIHYTEPWTLLRMLEPRAENGKRALQKLRTKLLRGPPNNTLECSSGGYVYIYYLQQDQHDHPNYWKVGTTSEGRVEKRMREWDRVHGAEAGCTLKRVYPTQSHRFAERVIHLYLHYCRVYRYRLEEEEEEDKKKKPIRYHSVWAKTNKAVEEEEEEEEEEKEGNGRVLRAKHKHVEWFIAPLQDIHVVIRDVITMLSVWERRKRQLQNKIK